MGKSGTALGPFVVAVTGNFEHRGRAGGRQFGTPRSLSAAMPAPHVRWAA